MFLWLNIMWVTDEKRSFCDCKLHEGNEILFSLARFSKQPKARAVVTWGKLWKSPAMHRVNTKLFLCTNTCSQKRMSTATFSVEIQKTDCFSSSQSEMTFECESFFPLVIWAFHSFTSETENSIKAQTILLWIFFRRLQSAWTAIVYWFYF